ncbi:MAG: hypothetical protein R3Y26_06405 [Rikenellaceae bacterium]
MRIIDRVDKYILYINLSDKQFSINCKLSLGLLSKARQKDCDLSKKSVDKILDYYKEINKTWLITGVGFMIKDEYKKK